MTRILKEPEERRNEILDAAEQLFFTKGYAKTTVNDILQAIGIAKGTFYYYFKSKEEVMDAVVMRYIDAGVEAAKRIARNNELSVHEKLFQIIMVQKPDTGRKGRLIEQFHQPENAQIHQSSLALTIHKLTPVLTEVIEQGIKEKLFRNPYPKESMEILLAVSQFLFDEGIFSWESEEYARKIEAFIYNMEMMLGAEKGSFAYVSRLIQTQPELADSDGGKEAGREGEQ